MSKKGGVTKTATVQSQSDVQTPSKVNLALKRGT